MKKLIFIILVGTLASCQVQEDPELQRLNLRKQELKEQAVKDSIRFERIERLVNAGATYDEAAHFVDSTYKF